MYVTLTILIWQLLWIELYQFKGMSQTPLLCFMPGDPFEYKLHFRCRTAFLKKKMLSNAWSRELWELTCFTDSVTHQNEHLRSEIFHHWYPRMELIQTILLQISYTLHRIGEIYKPNPSLLNHVPLCCQNKRWTPAWTGQSLMTFERCLVRHIVWHLLYNTCCWWSMDTSLLTPLS